MTPPAGPGRSLVPILAGGAGIGILASAIYAPSLPSIVVGLGVPEDRVQATFTVYLFAFALGQLVVGPLADRYGRRIILIVGLLVTAISSIVCALAPSIEVLLIARVVQALGSCAGPVVARAMVRDIYEGPRLTAAVSAMAMTIALAPAIAPVIGGQLEVWLGWRSCFWFVAALAIFLVAMVVIRIPETISHKASGSLLAVSADSYGRLWRDPMFMLFTVMTAGSSAVFYAHTAGGAPLLIGQGGMNPALFGWCATLPPLGFMTGSFLVNRLARHVRLHRLMGVGSTFLVVATAGMALSAWLLGVMSPWAYFPLMYLVGVGNGLTMPGAGVRGISRHPRIAGAAAALAGFIQMAGGAVGTVAVILFAQGHAVELGLVMLGSALTVFCAWAWVGRVPGGESTSSGDR